MPRVTVGMPVFNRAHLIADTIKQVLSQTYPNFELLIYNDGSTDGSSDIIKTFTDPRIKFFDRENLGPPYPLNSILDNAIGEFIIILHDHDFFHPQLIEKSVEALDRYPDAVFVLQGSAWVDEDGTSNYQEMLYDLPEYNLGRQFGVKYLCAPLSEGSIFHACSMVRKIAYDRIGNHYNPEFGLYADGDVWLQLLCDYSFVYIKEVLFKFRTRPKIGHFLSNREFEIADWIYKIKRKNILHYWTDTPERKKVLKRLNRSKYLRDIKLTIYYAANCNEGLLIRGLQKIRDSSEASLFSRTTSGFFLRSKRLRKLMSYLIHRLHKLKKKLNVSGSK